jgi:hypothetical protein
MCQKRTIFLSILQKRFFVKLFSHPCCLWRFRYKDHVLWSKFCNLPVLGRIAGWDAVIVIAAIRIVVVVVAFLWLWLLAYSQVYLERIHIRASGRFPCTDQAVQGTFLVVLG